MSEPSPPHRRKGTFVCASHGHCFDGLASAALLRRVIECTHPGLAFEVISCGYGQKQVRPSAEILDGEANAIVDFRYAPLDSLTHYYDHHKTAFGDDQDHAHFSAKKATSPDTFIYDGTYSSCTKLIFDSAARDLGLDLSADRELVEWADRIDAARFSSAAEATDTTHPVLRLAAVVEQFGDSPFLQSAVEHLLADGLDSLAESEFVLAPFRSVEAKQKEFFEQVRKRGAQLGRVAFVDLSPDKTSAVTKFVQYRLWPEATYSVMLAVMASGVRISVGHNPWSGIERQHDISKICARYGGGGHPMVGGIGLARDDLERARAIASEIVTELNRTPTDR